MRYFYHFWLQKTIDSNLLYDFFYDNFQNSDFRFRMTTKRNGCLDTERNIAVELEGVIPILSNDLGTGIVFVASPIDNDVAHRAIMKARSLGNGLYFLAEVLILMLAERDYALVPVLRSQLDEVPHELVKTADMFLKCGLNASDAADKLYIHRNTFNYRLSKFISLTGLDIRDYWTSQYYMILSRISSSK
ncbi:MAG: helix-turn-helix domain-containing protein [Bacilli bacterium]|jgi:hypothetical protein|nr:helix-turn-helix domain-containing protein [Bacilli bacterium]MCH4235614.1 helix-turn-helix domain-containing protein [Bacilli bacterium]